MVLAQSHVMAFVSCVRMLFLRTFGRLLVFVDLIRGVIRLLIEGFSWVEPLMAQSSSLCLALLYLRAS